jgi:hypothetical protein
MALKEVDLVGTVQMNANLPCPEGDPGEDLLKSYVLELQVIDSCFGFLKLLARVLDPEQFAPALEKMIGNFNMATLFLEGLKKGVLI